MKLVKESITLDEIKIIAKELFGNMVKVVVDVEKRIMVVGGELHSDGEAFLLENGSEQKNLWGINIYPEETNENFIEFDSLINIRPSQGNNSRNVDNPEIRKKIIEIVSEKIKL